MMRPTFAFPDFSQAKVLVVGDVMLDSYWHGPAAKISPEAPVPVVNVDKLDNKPGGAANVALNISSLGVKKITLLGVIGVDKEAQELKQVLNKANIDYYFQTLSGKPTINKLRIISQNQQLIRLDFEQSIEEEDLSELYAQYQSIVADYDVVLLSDYQKGTLKEVGQLIRQARAYGVPVLVDPKGNCFKKYHGATALTPNMKEFEQIVGSSKDEAELRQKAFQLKQELELDSLLLTRGAKGMTLFQASDSIYSLQAYAKEVFDVTGAGDTVISVLACSIAAQYPWKQAVEWANFAAAIVVGRLGAASVTLDELRGDSRVLSDKEFGILTHKLDKEEQPWILIDLNGSGFSHEQMQNLKKLKVQGKHIFAWLNLELDSYPLQLELLQELSLVEGILATKAEQFKTILARNTVLSAVPA